MAADLAQLATQVLSGLRATSPMEAVGVVTGLAYVVLAIRQDVRCWIAGAISTACYFAVFLRSGLYLQMTLQIYYLGIAAYGWRRWRGDAGRLVTRWRWQAHALGLLLVLLLSAASAVLDRSIPAGVAYLDALSTWGSVFASWLVTRKVLENWTWWLALDCLIVLLCWRQQLYASAVLYAVYLVLVVIGWRAWWRVFQTTSPAPAGNPP